MAVKGHASARPEFALACWGLVCVAAQLLLLVTEPAAGASHWVLNEERGVIELVPLTLQADNCDAAAGSCVADAGQGSSSGPTASKARRRQAGGKKQDAGPAPHERAGGDQQGKMELELWNRLEQSVGGRLKEAEEAFAERGRLQGKGASPVRDRKLQPDPSLAVLFESRYGGVAKALDLLEQSTKSNPMDPILWSDLGNAYRVMGDTRKAVNCFETALRLQAHPDFFLNLGGLHYALGELEEAVQLFTIGLQMNPRHAMLQFSMGNILAKQGKVDDAMTSYETALRIQPEFKPAELSLMHMRQQFGRKGYGSLTREGWILFAIFVFLVIVVQRTVHFVFMWPNEQDKGTTKPASDAKQDASRGRGGRRDREKAGAKG